MAGKGEIVEQALKLIAGGATGDTATAAARAAENAALLKDASRLGVDTSNVGALQDTKRLIDFHKNMMGDIKDRAQKLQDIQRELQDSGAFPLEVGSRYTTSHSREKGLPPHTITGYFVDPKDPYNRYGYRVRREFGNGDYEEGINLIRDPKLEQMHGPEKWKMLQESIQPFTGLRTVKEYGGSVREGYAGKGAITDPYADEVARAKAAMAEKQYSEQPWSEWAGDVVGNAVNTAKAILPTALGGEGRVGVTDIARGAYEGAKDAVTFPGDVLTGKQALFDESGRPLESAVGRSLNAVGAVGGASSLVPVPSNSLRVFGGSRSRTADKNALTQAQILESQAADRDAIWRQSGWGRGAEGRWRYEIPDVGTTVDPSKFNLDLSSTAIPSSMVTTLGEYINHPELFDAYPEFKTMPVKGYYDPNSNVSGYYMPRYSRGTINPGFSDPYIALNLSHLPTVEAQRATLLHEIQHAIQQKEGFVPGTNVASRPLQTANPLYAFYKDALKTEPELQELEALRATDAFKAEQAEKQVLFAEFQKKIQELDERQAATGVSTKQEYVDAVNDYMKKTEGRFPLAVKAARLGFDLEDRGIPSSEPPEFLDQEGAYLADAGEVESRNVQNRKDAPREELKERPPWRTQDRRYPYEGQIIDWNNTSWRKGYSVGGASDSDRDIESAMMIAGAR